MYEIGGLGGARPVELPRRAAPLVELATPLAVRFGILDGIHVTPADHDGELTHLSPLQARVLARQPVDHLQTVSLELPANAGGAAASDAPGTRSIYAKVIAAEDQGTRLLLHFTSVAPGAERAIAALCGAK